MYVSHRDKWTKSIKRFIHLWYCKLRFVYNSFIVVKFYNMTNLSTYRKKKTEDEIK